MFMTEDHGMWPTEFPDTISWGPEVVTTRTQRDLFDQEPPSELVTQSLRGLLPANKDKRRISLQPHLTGKLTEG